MIRLGAGLFAVGVLLIAVELISFATGTRNLPLWLDVLAGTLAPLGFIVAVGSAIRSGRREQRAALTAVRSADSLDQFARRGSAGTG